MGGHVFLATDTLPILLFGMLACIVWLNYRIYSNNSRINFSLAGVWLLIEGGFYSRAAFIYFGAKPLGVLSR
jgi:hypothetical protein